MSEEKAENFHQFWGTQPVPQEGQEKTVTFGPIDVPKTVDDVQKTPYPLASILEWWSPDLNKAEDLTAVYELLRDNYVEDHDSIFRFNYSREFLKWALVLPDYIQDWHVGVRRKKDGKLLAFIAGVPIKMQMGLPASKVTSENEHEEKHNETRRICEINFLCVHKILRDKRMAPILIKEVTRRVNLCNIWQAIYTSGTLLPTPFSSARYHHRSLNPEKLVAVRFSTMPPAYHKFQNPMAMLKKTFQLPDKPKTQGLREMKPADVPQVHKLLMEELKKYDVHPVFDEDEVAHTFVPREGVISTYVVESKPGHVTDFFSFYALPSTLIGNSKYSHLNAAYMHYYAANTVPVKVLINDLLIVAHSKGFDVVNMVNILRNDEVIQDLKFALGDGHLHYYFYNWAYPDTPPQRVGLVML